MKSSTAPGTTNAVSLSQGFALSISSRLQTRSYYVTQTSWAQTYNPPASASQVLGLQTLGTQLALQSYLKASLQLENVRTELNKKKSASMRPL